MTFCLYLISSTFSDIIIFKQQYPQNINIVQENMIYGTSEKNNYKKIDIFLHNQGRKIHMHTQEKTQVMGKAEIEIYWLRTQPQILPTQSLNLTSHGHERA